MKKITFVELDPRKDKLESLKKVVKEIEKNKYVITNFTIEVRE